LGDDKVNSKLERNQIQSIKFEEHFEVSSFQTSIIKQNTYFLNYHSNVHDYKVLQFVQIKTLKA
jgi:hypothetical protein